jgi:ribosomal protein S2
MNSIQLKSTLINKYRKKGNDILLITDKSSTLSREILFLSGYAIKKGIPVGHKFLRLSKTNFWHPLMAPYFLGIRHGISFLDPVQTRKSILRAFYVIALVLNRKETSIMDSRFIKSHNKQRAIHPNYLVGSTSFFNGGKKQELYTQEKKQIIQRKGHVLIINTNPEFSQLCKNLSALILHKRNKKLLDFKNQDNSSLSYIYYKWVGGTLTNWKQVSKSVLSYVKFAERCEKFLYRNRIDFPRYKKVKECFYGLIRKQQNRVHLAFNEKPDLIFLMNPNENRHIIAEANKMHIPVVALVESNTYLKGISYPIPANAYSAYYIYYCLKKILQISKT